MVKTAEGRPIGNCCCGDDEEFLCCCPGFPVISTLYITMYEMNDCLCVDGSTVTLTLTDTTQGAAGPSAVAATWEGNGRFCAPLTGTGTGTGSGSEPVDAGCDIYFKLQCSPPGSCVWTLTYCTDAASGNPCTPNLNAGNPATAACEGIGPSTSCDPLQVVFGTGVSDNVCCSPDFAASQFCFVVNE